MDKICIVEDALTNQLEKVERDGLRYLKKHCEFYQIANMRMKEILQNEKINAFLTESEELHLNMEETEMFREYLALENRMDSLEHLYAYLRGYADHEAMKQLLDEIGNIFEE